MSQAVVTTTNSNSNSNVVAILNKDKKQVGSKFFLHGATVGEHTGGIAAMCKAYRAEHGCSSKAARKAVVATMEPNAMVAAKMFAAGKQEQWESSGLRIEVVEEKKDKEGAVKSGIIRYTRIEAPVVKLTDEDKVDVENLSKENAQALLKKLMAKVAASK